MIGTGAVQSEIVRLLVAAAIVGDRVTEKPIVDPTAFGFPFIEIANAQTLSDDVSGRSGADEFLTLDIWSQAGDAIEVKNIAGAVAQIFNAASLAIAGYGSVHVFVDSLRVITQSYGFIAHHGVMTLRIHAFGEQEI